MISANLMRSRLRNLEKETVVGKMPRWLCDAIRVNCVRPFVSYCEVGVLEGTSANAVIEVLRPRKVFLIDTWKPYPPGRPDPPSKEWDKHRLKTVEDLEAIYQRVLKRFSHLYSVRICRCTSLQFAGLNYRSRFDVVFIDADHMYETTKADVEAYWPMVKNGGLLIGHDYNSRAEQTWKYWGVKKAVDEFAANNNLEVDSTSGCKLWWIKK